MPGQVGAAAVCLYLVGLRSSEGDAAYLGFQGQGGVGIERDVCTVEHHFYRVVLLAVAGLDDEVEFHSGLVKIVHQVHLGVEVFGV